MKKIILGLCLFLCACDERQTPLTVSQEAAIKACPSGWTVRYVRWIDTINVYCTAEDVK